MSYKVLKNKPESSGERTFHENSKGNREQRKDWESSGKGTDFCERAKEPRIWTGKEKGQRENTTVVKKFVAKVGRKKRLSESGRPLSNKRV